MNTIDTKIDTSLEQVELQEAIKDSTWLKKFKVLTFKDLLNLTAR